MAVGRRAHDRLGGDVGARAWPVFDDEWLTEPLREPLTHQACENVDPAARSEADDHPHRPRRIGLRPGEARQDRECNGTQGQTLKTSARKSHAVLPRFMRIASHAVSWLLSRGIEEDSGCRYA